MLTSEHRRLAFAAADTLVWLQERRGDVIERNAARIARAKRVIDARPPMLGFRRSTAFIENIEKLVSGSTGASAETLLTPVAPPRPPSRRRARP